MSVLADDIETHRSKGHRTPTRPLNRICLLASHGGDQQNSLKLRQLLQLADIDGANY
jgi:hypothetical protein